MSLAITRAERSGWPHSLLRAALAPHGGVHAWLEHVLHPPRPSNPELAPHLVYSAGGLTQIGALPLAPPCLNHRAELWVGPITAALPGLTISWRTSEPATCFSIDVLAAEIGANLFRNQRYSSTANGLCVHAGTIMEKRNREAYVSWLRDIFSEQPAPNTLAVLDIPPHVESAELQRWSIDLRDACKRIVLGFKIPELSPKHLRWVGAHALCFDMAAAPWRHRTPWAELHHFAERVQHEGLPIIAINAPEHPCGRLRKSNIEMIGGNIAGACNGSDVQQGQTNQGISAMQASAALDSR